MPTLHIHLDESGDLTFSPKGSTYYVFAITWTQTPAALATALTGLRYGFLRQGYDVEYFHACEDRQDHRNDVVAVIGAATDLSFAGMVIEKRKVNPSIRDPHDQPAIPGAGQGDPAPCGPFPEPTPSP